MSILFGILQGEGHLIEERQLMEMSRRTSRFAPDGTQVRAIDGIGMGLQPYHTHLRSDLECGPSVDVRGNMVALDGRIDNHRELCALLNIHDDAISDSRIVLMAFERWGEECFSRLLGDWAIALWSPVDRSLYLARDHAGTRTLYFEQKNATIRWSTHLETFFVDRSSHPLDESYAARFLVCQPVGDLTPFREIRSVTPAHYLVFRDNKVVRRPHWQWMIQDQLSLKDDAEYEERFLSLFRQSVERRTGPGAPILAQLSGGMDSSSIVCMSDHIRRRFGAEAKDLLDTVSYYDDSDSNWNEAPYFQCVERLRQKTGVHLPLPLLSAGLHPSPVSYLVPGADNATFENEMRFEARLRPRDYRVILSGIGGDEVLGGVPTALPELADYLASGELVTFARRALAWCLVDRTPFTHMVASTIRFLIHQYSRAKVSASDLPPWATPQLDRLLRTSCQIWAGQKAPRRVAPSSIMNGRAWWLTLETLPHLNPGHLIRREYRYPYLDRDLIEFLFRVPRERLLGPGRRRSMMRNALRGIVPAEVIERRRKGFRSRGVLIPLSASTERIRELSRDSLAARMGLVNPANLTEAVLNALHEPGHRWVSAVIRFVLFELWGASIDQAAAGYGFPSDSRKSVAWVRNAQDPSR